MGIPIKYSTTQVANTIKTNNIVLGTKTMDYGPTSSTGFYVGIDSPASGYTIYQVFGEGQQPKAVVANNDEECIWFARSFGGSNINTISEAISYFVTGSTGTTIVNMDYPNIVTNGLVLNLDAGFLPSYPRIGEIWRDISGNNNNGTLINNPSYDSDNNGKLNFSGYNRYWTKTQNTTLSDHTIISFVNLSGITESYIPIFEFIWTGAPYYRAHYYVEGSTNTNISARQSFGANWYNGTINQDSWTFPTQAIVSGNTWCMLTGILNGTSGYTYVNLELAKNVLTGITYNNVMSSGFRNSRLLGSLLYPNGYVAITMLYNRALSFIELEQNFNAYRGRFGL